MAEPRIELHGIPQLAKATNDLTIRIGKSTTRRFGQIAEQRAQIVRGRVPRVSGALAGSVQAVGSSVGMGSESVPYAGWIEFGGSREGGRNSTAERPYLPEGRYYWPTMVGTEPELQSEAGRTATDEIRGYQWPNPT